MKQDNNGITSLLQESSVDPMTLKPYTTRVSIKSDNFKPKDENGNNGKGWEIKVDNQGRLSVEVHGQGCKNSSREQALKILGVEDTGQSEGDLAKAVMEKARATPEGQFIVEADKLSINGATINDSALDAFRLRMKNGLAAGFAGVDKGICDSSILPTPPLPKRWYPEEFAGGLGRGDTIPTAHMATASTRNPRLIAVTQRKIESLEGQIQALISEVSLYANVDPYVIKLAKDNLTIGPTLLHKALSDLQLDDGK